MKAIALERYVKDYSELRPSDIPPPVVGSDEVAIDVTHVGLGHVDLLYARGKHQNNHRGLVSPPFILGLEFAGLVTSRTSKFQPGDRVFGWKVGAFAEKLVVKEAGLLHIPEPWTLEDAAGMGATAPVSYGALVHVAKLGDQETILVHAAAGALGSIACKIAHGLGARVIGTVGSEEKADMVRSMGFDVIRYDQDEWEKKVLGLTGGVDVVFDTVGLVEKSLRCLKYGGRIVVAGFAGLEGNMEKVAMNRVLLKGATLLGYRYGESGRRNPSENAAIWEGLIKMVERGLVKPVIYKTRYRGLESIPRAMQDLAERKIWGKAVVELALLSKL